MAKEEIFSISKPLAAADLNKLIDEAPKDGNAYVRRNKQWEQLTFATDTTFGAIKAGWNETEFEIKTI